MPTVAVDATPLLGRRTGIGSTVATLLGEISGRPGLELVGFALSRRGGRSLPGLLPEGVAAARPRPLPARPLLAMWGRVDLPPAEWWTGAVDVVHGTNYVLPPSRRAAAVVTVNDLFALHHPEQCPPAARRYPGLVRRAASSGAHVHVPSGHVAGEVVDRLAVPAERIHVIPWGVRPAPPAARPATGPRYVLALGTAEPRKDLPTLVRAFDRVAESHPDLRLRLVGPVGWGERQLAGAVAAARHRDRVDRVGWVQDPAAELAGAAVLAYPSLDEGFGLPPLEAMAAGVPVVAAAAGAIPEVVGGAALLVPPRRPSALAEALVAVLDDTATSDRLVSGGLRQAARYPWSACADAVVDLYRRLAVSA